MIESSFRCSFVLNILVQMIVETVLVAISAQTSRSLAHLSFPGFCFWTKPFCGVVRLSPHFAGGQLSEVDEDQEV